jgi:hypothetical protein
VQFPGQLTGPSKTGIAADRLGPAILPVPGDVPVQEAQNLPPLLVHPQKSGSACPPCSLQENQQLTDEPRVALKSPTDRTPNRVPDPNGTADPATEQHLLLHARHPLTWLRFSSHTCQSAAPVTG